jgi:hypothetical protein
MVAYSPRTGPCAGVTERVSAGWLANEATRLDGLIAKCEALDALLAPAEHAARVLHVTAALDGNVDRSIRDTLTLIEDARSATKAAREDLLADLVPAMED